MIGSLGYVGIEADDLATWRDYGTRFLGMQLVDRAASGFAFRMDDRKQRLIVQEQPDAPAVFGWEVADAAALEAVAAKVEAGGYEVKAGGEALAAQRFVTGLIVFHDPAGNRLEVFYGPEVAADAFTPGRNISGFRTGPLGMGHIVLTAKRIDRIMPFYVDVLGFRLSDYMLKPFKAFFLHVNPRHHSLAFIETGTNGIHHLMIELLSLDDVGQAYDLALHHPQSIGTTFGRHTNDFMTSFYSKSPSRLLVECGWGGRTIDPTAWKAEEVLYGPSLWGHERTWLPEQARHAAQALREQAAADGQRQPVQVMPGNHELSVGICPWWDRSAGSK